MNFNSQIALLSQWISSSWNIIMNFDFIIWLGMCFWCPEFNFSAASKTGYFPNIYMRFVGNFTEQLILINFVICFIMGVSG